MFLAQKNVQYVCGSLWDVKLAETVVAPLKGTKSADCSVAISNDSDCVVS